MVDGKGLPPPLQLRSISGVPFNLWKFNRGGGVLALTPWTWFDVPIRAKEMGAVRIEIDDEVRRVRLEFHVMEGLPSFTTEPMSVSVALAERKPEESLTIEVEHPFGVAAQHDNSSTASLR